MGIVLEGFSIREYTSKIRTTNVEKCWPFDGNPNELKKQVLEDLLPPITIKKFKWWSNDVIEEEVVLEKDSGFDKQVVVLRNEEYRMVVKCPVCLSYKGSSVNAMDVHVDSCLARVLRKEHKKAAARMVGKVKMGKSPKKLPIKKRSIMEIFAVAPQIEGLDCEEYDSKDEEEIDDDEKKSKDEEEVVGILKKLKNASKKKKKKRMKMKSIAKKEKTHKFKGLIQIALVETLKSSMSKKKANSKTKPLSKPNKLKTIWASRKYREPIGNLVHGILKKRKTVDSSGTCSAIGNTPGIAEIFRLANHLHKADKHAQFSGCGDYILGSPSSISCFQMQNSCEVHSLDSMVFPSVNHQVEKGNNVLRATSKAAEVNGSSKDVVIGVMCGAGFQSMNENEGVDDIGCGISLSTYGSSNSMKCQDRGQALSDEYVRLAGDYPPLENFHLLNRGKSSSSRNFSYASITGLDSSSQTGLMNLPDKCAASMHRFSVMDSMADATSEALTDVRDPFFRQDTLQNLESTQSSASHQPFFQLLPKNLTTSLPKQDKATPSVYENRFHDDNFIGLPLNSQGELINIPPRGKGGVNQLKKKQNIKNSASNLPAHNFVGEKSSVDHLDYNRSCYVGTKYPKDKFNFFPEQDYAANFKISLRRGVCDLPRGTEVPRKNLMEGKNKSVHQLGFDLNQMNISSCACSQYRPTQSQTEKEKVRRVDNSNHGCLQTMRLMGKDVTVGRNVKKSQVSDDGKVWTDKNVIKEHCPVVVENSSLTWNFELEATVNASSKKLKETRIQSLGSQGKQTRPYFSQNTIDAQFAHSSQNWRQANKTPKSCMALTSGKQSINMHHFVYPLHAE